jgi:hypothetical protein
MQDNFRDEDTKLGFVEVKQSFRHAIDKLSRESCIAQRPEESSSFTFKPAWINISKHLTCPLAAA